MEHAMASVVKALPHNEQRRVRPTSSTATTSPSTSAGSLRDATLQKGMMYPSDDSSCGKPRRRRSQSFAQAPSQQPQRQETLWKWHHSWAFFATLVVVLFVCFAWTLWLLLLTLAPNATINYVMQTQELDNGSFWLLVEPPFALKVLAVTGLSTVALGYLVVGVMLVNWGRKRFSVAMAAATKCNPAESSSPLSPSAPSLSDLHQQLGLRLSSVAPAQPPPKQGAEGEKRTPSARRASLVHIYNELSHEASTTRKLGHVSLKVADVLLQQFFLFQILEAGFPLPLVTICTIMVVCNALAGATLMHTPSPPSRVTEALVDSISDLIVAVGFPMLVLSYCLLTFDYDHVSMRLATELFPRWAFERAARVQADPYKTATIFKSLDGLQLNSVTICLARLGTNLVVLYGLYRLVELLRSSAISPGAGANTQSHRRDAHGGNVYPRKHPAALLLVGLALATVIYVVVCVQRSHDACHSVHTHCAMHAHRVWFSKSPSHDSGPATTNCPCLVLIDVDLAPTTYEAWVTPPDATDTVAELAASGDLEIVQIVNRRLVELPEALRQCTHLKHLALVLTHTTTLPTWAAEFTELEFLHVEGKSDELSLTSLPRGLFDNMALLTFVHLGRHPNIPEMPAFAGLTNLRSITMAGLESVRALPADMAQLEHLEMLLSMMMHKMEVYPDLSNSLGSLNALVVDPSPLCCNGFLHSKCDFTGPLCGNDRGPTTVATPPRRCLPPERRASLGSLEVFKRFEATVCAKDDKQPPSGPRSDNTGSVSGNGPTTGGDGGSNGAPNPNPIGALPPTDGVSPGATPDNGATPDVSPGAPLDNGPAPGVGPSTARTSGGPTPGYVPPGTPMGGSPLPGDSSPSGGSPSTSVASAPSFPAGDAPPGGGPPSDADREASLKRGIEQCRGVQYLKCELEDDDHGPQGDDGVGMCKSERFNPITCSNNPSAIELRRRQIALGVGQPCDPEYEAWLGCT